MELAAASRRPGLLAAGASESRRGPPKKGRRDKACLPFFQLPMWVWVKIKPENGQRVLVFGSVYQGKPFWGYPIFDNHSHAALFVALSAVEPILSGSPCG